MATITQFKKWHEQPDLTVNGQLVEVDETWMLQLNTRSSTVTAQSLINALTAGNIYSWPVIGEGTHADDSNLTAVNYTISRDPQGGFKFLVSLHYTSDPDQISDSKSRDSGEASYDYQEVKILEEIDFDPIEEKAIQNSADGQIWPKLQRARTLDRIVITRNEDRFKPSDKKRFRNKVNSTSISIDGYSYETNSCLMESITGKRQLDADGNVFYVVKYVILYDPDQLHRKTLLDVHTGPDVNKTFPQQHGTKWNKPWKLDGNGAYLSLADQKNPSAYSTNTFNIYPEVNMNSLRL